MLNLAHLPPADPPPSFLEGLTPLRVVCHNWVATHLRVMVKFPIQINLSEKEAMVLYPVHFFVLAVMVVCFAVLAYAVLMAL